MWPWSWPDVAQVLGRCGWILGRCGPGPFLVIPTARLGPLRHTPYSQFSHSTHLPICLPSPAPLSALRACSRQKIERALALLGVARGEADGDPDGESCQAHTPLPSAALDTRDVAQVRLAGLTPAASVLGLGSPLPHLRCLAVRDAHERKVGDWLAWA